MPILDNAIYDELKEAAKNHKITRDLEINIRSALLERDAQAVRYAEQIKKLTETLNEWSESYRKIIGDGGCPDEVHCACVPALREELARRENTEQERADFVRKAIGSSSLEALIVRYKEMVGVLDKVKELLNDDLLPYLNRQGMLADDGDAVELREYVLSWLKEAWNG